MSNQVQVRGGVGIGGLLGLLFIGLKLGHVIDWDWLWVLSPFWIPFAIVLVVVIVFGLIAAFCKAGIYLIDKTNKK